MQANGIDGIWTTIASLPGWQEFLIVVATAMAAAVVLRVGGDRLLKPLTERIPGDVDDIVFGGAHRALCLTTAIGAASLGFTLFDSPDLGYSFPGRCCWNCEPESPRSVPPCRLIG
jgi:hypothetical protein